MLNPTPSITNSQPTELSPAPELEPESSVSPTALVNTAPTQTNAITQISSPSSSATATAASYQVGASGQAVKDIQTRLSVYGYTISVDGQFGPATKRCVIAFQSRLGLKANGIVDLTTLAELAKEPTEATEYIPTSYDKFNSTDTAGKEAFMNGNSLISKTSYFITVSLTNREVNIYEGSNKNWSLIETFSCSVGASKTPTITGEFTIGEKGKSFGQNKGFICYYYTQISGNYLFHSTLYNLDGSDQDSRLGLAISHGCIRMAKDSAKYIYDNIPRDTTVLIK